MTRDLDDDLLLDVVLQLGGTLEIEELLARVVGRLRASFGAERAMFALCDATGRLGRAVSVGIDRSADGTLPVSHGVIARAVRDRDPVVLTNAQNEGDFRENESVQALGLRLIVAVAVPGRDQVLGVLYVDAQQPTLAQVATRVDQLVAVSKIVGIAVENAQLYDRQRARSHLLAELVYDFRLPLGEIASHAELLAEEVSGEAADIAREIGAATQRVARRIDGTMALARLQSAAAWPPPRKIDPATAIARHLADLSGSGNPWPDVAVHAEPGLPDVETVPERLFIAIDNLLANAFDAALGPCTVHVDVRLRADAGPDESCHVDLDDTPWNPRQLAPLVSRAGAPFLEVSVRPEGRAVPGELLPRRLQPFVTGNERPRGGGSGLGVHIAERCARQLGGRLWVDVPPGAPARFVFTVPTELAAADVAR